MFIKASRIEKKKFIEANSFLGGLNHETLAIFHGLKAQILSESSNYLLLFVFESCYIYLSEFIDGVSQFSVKCNKESKLRCKYATCQSADSTALRDIILALSYRMSHQVRKPTEII